MLLDITSDIALPCVAALATDLDGRHVAVGFAAKPLLNDAIDSALSEMMMLEFKVALARAGMENGPDLSAWFDEIEFGGPQPFAGGPRCHDVRAAHAADSEHELVDALASAGCRVAYIDCTRPEFGIPAVRAVSPDLCHYKPRFGRSRLHFGSQGPDLNGPLLRI